LKSTLKWRHFYLYVLLDIFSRYVVGWLVAHAENAGLARALIEETCAKHGIAPETLMLHSDHGSPMRAESTAELLVDLGVAASFSRPRVSNDNPFSEAQFKTLKYRPEFPEPRE
jgi:putative transposase